MRRPFTLREFISVYNKKDMINESLEYHSMKAHKVEYKDFYNMSQLISEELDKQNPSEKRDIDGWFLDTDINLVPDFDLTRFSENTIFNFDLKDQLRDRMNLDMTLADVKEKFRSQKHIINILNQKFLVDILFINSKSSFYMETEQPNDPLKIIPVSTVVSLLTDPPLQ